MFNWMEWMRRQDLEKAARYGPDPEGWPGYGEMLPWGGYRNNSIQEGTDESTAASPDDRGRGPRES